MGNKGSKSTPAKEAESPHPAQSETVGKEEATLPSTVEFADIKDTLKTGDLLILYRKDATFPNYGIIINNSENEVYFPHLLVKGVTKPTSKESFIRKKRYLTAVTAVVRIFYGDYDRVAVCKLKSTSQISSTQALDFVDDIDSYPYIESELATIEDAESPETRSVCTAIINLSLLYKEMKVIQEPVADVLSVLGKWHTTLPVEEPVFINVPPIKPGPMKKGEPPLYQKILRGLMPFTADTHKTYDEIRDQLNTGDIILFSTVGLSGFVIKLAGQNQFSHVGIVLKPKMSKTLMVWESVSNSVGIADLGSGEVQAGTQIVPLRHKIFNGYNDEVAIRKLVDVTEEQRANIHETIMKLTKDLEGTKYEANKFDLVKAELDFAEDYLTFLKSDEEDISTLFCSEVVAHAYQEAGLLGKETPSDEYTPDDFASSCDLQLKYGKLEPEIFIQLKYED